MENLIATDSATEKKEIIAKHFKAIMETLWLDLTDDSLCDTPKRVAKMYVDEMFYWLDNKNLPRIMTVENKMSYDHMLLERDIKVQSCCEHHRKDIIWKAHVAYIPKDKIIGLSKLNRIVDFYCRKPQIQERLTNEIHNKLVEVLETEDVAVVIDAVHMCVVTRWVKDINSSTVTSKLWGVFKETAVRKELLDLIKLS